MTRKLPLMKDVSLPSVIVLRGVYHGSVHPEGTQQTCLYVNG